MTDSLSLTEAHCECAVSLGAIANNVGPTYRCLTYSPIDTEIIKDALIETGLKFTVGFWFIEKSQHGTK